MDFTDIIPTLQFALAPVILISGVGLLLLSLTNRYGRVIDRARVLGDGARSSKEGVRHLREQIEILLYRARLLRASIIYGVVAVLCAALLVIGLFLGTVLHTGTAALVVVLFSACMVALILSLVYFLRDINASLRALDLEMEDVAPTYPLKKATKPDQVYSCESYQRPTGQKTTFEVD